MQITKKNTCFQKWRTHLLKIVSVFLFMTCFSPLFAQKKDTLIATKIRPGIMWFYTGLKPSNGVWLPRYDRFMVDIKYNDLVNPQAIKMFNTNWKSIGFNTQFVFDIPMNRYNTSGFGIGFGYQFSKFVHNRILFSSSDGLYDFTDALLINFDKSILRTHTFFVPVEFRFRTKGWQHFKVHIGSNIGYRYGNNKLYVGSTTTRTRTGKMSNFEWLYLDAHIRMGIRNFAIIASTDLLPIFKKTDVKQVPVSLGVTVSLF